MADSTPNVKKFLDYAGLAQFWGIITNRFADKNKTVTKLTISTSDDGKVQTLVGSMIDTTAAATSVALPNATRDHAGLMSADHFAAVADLQTNIDKFAPFAGLKLGDGVDDNEVSLSGRKATIGLEYQTERANDGTASKAYIALLDPNYPSEGRWAEVDQAAYDAATDKTSYATVKQESGSYKYYVWTYAAEGATGAALTPAVKDGQAVAGPVNALGEPIYSQPISRIDVTELVKTGLLIDSDVVVLDAASAPDKMGGTYLKLIFNAVKEDGSANPQTQYINVTDLVELYEAGDGIELTEVANTGMDDKSRSAKINVIAATADKFGGLKIGYNEGNKCYAVKLDTDGKAYVHTPWDETTVVVSTPETHVDKEGKPYVVVTNASSTVDNADGSKTNKYAFSVQVGEGVQKAEAAARSSVQTVNGDAGYVNVSKNTAADYNNSVTVTLDQTVKDSLALADTAVQKIEAGVVTRAQAEGTNDLVITPAADAADKGKKAYTITLGDRTVNSLNLADSAIQEVTIMGTKLNETNTVYTAAEAKLAMSLGSASEVNITEDVTLAEQETVVKGPKEETHSRSTVATTAAVKTYVDETAKSIKTSYEGLVTSTIEGLDSSLTAVKVGAATNAQGVDAQQVFTKIVIENGKLVAPDAQGVENKSEVRTLTISDITDFRPFTSDEINEICGIATTPAE
jgi:hypothetical protein